MWRNDQGCYGLVAVTLHWLTALAVVGLFALGVWMVELSYYDIWYRRAPDAHRSAGVLLFGVVAFRLLWRLVNPTPRHDPRVSGLEQRLAGLAHRLLYLLLFAVILSGYMISTADGRAVDVFGLFSVPATISGLENQEDMAGDVHRALSYALVGIAGVHALAALKHHFIDGDRTLDRMLGRRN